MERQAFNLSLGRLKQTIVKFKAYLGDRVSPSHLAAEILSLKKK